MEEIWKDVPGWEGLYQASTLGRVRSLDKMITVDSEILGKYTRFSKGKILKPRITKEGKEQVCLLKGHVRNYFQIITIISRTFIPNPENKPKAMHIDGDRYNNRVDNITWATWKEIQQNSWSKKRKGNIITFEGKTFNTEAAAARYYGISEATYRGRKKQNWSLEETFKIKQGAIKTGGKTYLYKYKGKSYTLKQIEKMKGIPRNTLQKRLDSGWGLCEAVETPLVIRNRKKEV